MCSFEMSSANSKILIAAAFSLNPFKALAKWMWALIESGLSLIAASQSFDASKYSFSWISAWARLVKITWFPSNCKIALVYSSFAFL